MPRPISSAVLMLLGFASCTAQSELRRHTTAAVRVDFHEYDRVGIWSTLSRRDEGVLLVEYMLAFPGHTIIERRDLAVIMGEQDLLPERLDQETRARLREILGVQAVLYPSRSQHRDEFWLGQKTHVTYALRVIDTETGDIVASVTAPSIWAAVDGLQRAR